MGVSQGIEEVGFAFVLPKAAGLEVPTQGDSLAKIDNHHIESQNIGIGQSVIQDSGV